MVKLNKRTTLRAIIHAYRNGAYLVIALPIEGNTMYARRAVRQFGPISRISHEPNNETAYIYDNFNENIQVIQFTQGHVKDVKPDPQKPKKETISEARQSSLEKAIIKAYQRGSQILIGYPPAQDEHEARHRLKPFGEATVSISDDQRTQYVVDDIQNQIKAVVAIGYPQ